MPNYPQMDDHTSTPMRRAYERWRLAPTSGELARDKDGDPAHPCSGFAVCWCAEGALACELAAIATHENAAEMSKVRDCLVGSAQQLGEFGAYRINDHHPELLPDLWSYAIEAEDALLQLER